MTPSLAIAAIVLICVALVSVAVAAVGDPRRTHSK